MSVRSLIIEQIELIAKQQSIKLAPLTEELPLFNSGLDSLAIAMLVAFLDDKLGVDPFAGDGESFFPVTLGDFIALYEPAHAEP